MGTGSFVIATLLVLTGTAMIMINLGYGSWNMLRAAADFWPIILILIGFGMLWGDRIPKWLAYTVVLALAIGLVFFLYQQPSVVMPVIPPGGGG